MKRIFLSLIFLLFSVSSIAQVLGPSITEVKFELSTDFITSDTETNYTDQARNHVDYLFGILHTDYVARQFGLNWNKVGGIGSPNSEIEINARYRTQKNGQVLVTYVARGKLLLHNNAADKILQAGAVTLPLPYDLSQVYDSRCTDDYYNSESDYWYFWNPFKRVCNYLLQEPYTKQVNVYVLPGDYVAQDKMARLDLLRGDNGNGDIFSIYAIHGFNENSGKEDEGRINFEEMNAYFRENGFNEKVVRKTYNRPLHVFTKQITLLDGSSITVEVKSLLANTDIDRNTKTFAQFMREAVYHADVVFYAGHSGLGGNLDIASLEEIAGPFVFNKNKQQLFFFDSCASYSYYLESFTSVKTNLTLNVMTNALSSYFHTTGATTRAFFDSLLATNVHDLSWIDILSAMERPLRGGSYLINVGGF